MKESTKMLVNGCIVSFAQGFCEGATAMVTLVKVITEPKIHKKIFWGVLGFNCVALQIYTNRKYQSDLADQITSQQIKEDVDEMFPR